jgi:hypothetical protein
MSAIGRRRVLKGMRAAALSAVLPVGAVSFVDEGNQIPGPLPGSRCERPVPGDLHLRARHRGPADAGPALPRPREDEGTFRGSNYARVHSKYCRKTALRNIRAGARGVILSLKYSEMKFANLRAAREGID